jgi:hypothetical protein
VGRGGVGVVLQDLAAGGDPLERESLATGVFDDELGEIKCGTSELPGGGEVGGIGELPFAGLVQELFEARQKIGGWVGGVGLEWDEQGAREQRDYEEPGQGANGRGSGCGGKPCSVRGSRGIHSCHAGLPIYTPAMLARWRSLRWALVLAVMGLLTGCSGINTTHSVSPATFLLPGLGQVGEPSIDTPSEGVPTPLLLVAQTR